MSFSSTKLNFFHLNIIPNAFYKDIMPYFYCMHVEMNADHCCHRGESSSIDLHRCVDTLYISPAGHCEGRFLGPIVTL